MSAEMSWVLLYTKRHAEAWAELNLRNQGFSTLLPRVRSSDGFAPLFPRYLFAGHHEARLPSSMQHTFGVMYVVHCGDRPALVPVAVITDIRDRMDQHGIVRLDVTHASATLFSSRQQQRLQTLAKFAAAGFRVRAA